MQYQAWTGSPLGPAMDRSQEQSPAKPLEWTPVHCCVLPGPSGKPMRWIYRIGPPASAKQTGQKQTGPKSRRPRSLEAVRAVWRRCGARVASQRCPILRSGVSSLPLTVCQDQCRCRRPQAINPTVAGPAEDRMNPMELRPRILMDAIEAVPDRCMDDASVRGVTSPAAEDHHCT